MPHLLNLISKSTFIRKIAITASVGSSQYKLTRCAHLTKTRSSGDLESCAFVDFSLHHACPIFCSAPRSSSVCPHSHAHARAATRPRSTSCERSSRPSSSSSSSQKAASLSWKSAGIRQFPLAICTAARVLASGRRCIFITRWPPRRFSPEDDARSVVPRQKADTTSSAVLC